MTFYQIWSILYTTERFMLSKICQTQNDKSTCSPFVWELILLLFYFILNFFSKYIKNGRNYMTYSKAITASTMTNFGESFLSILAGILFMSLDCAEGTTYYCTQKYFYYKTLKDFLESI